MSKPRIVSTARAQFVDIPRTQNPNVEASLFTSSRLVEQPHLLPTTSHLPDPNNLKDTMSELTSEDP